MKIIDKISEITKIKIKDCSDSIFISMEFLPTHIIQIIKRNKRILILNNKGEINTLNKKNLIQELKELRKQYCIEQENIKLLQYVFSQDVDIQQLNGDILIESDNLLEFARNIPLIQTEENENYNFIEILDKDYVPLLNEKSFEYWKKRAHWNEENLEEYLFGE